MYDIYIYMINIYIYIYDIYIYIIVNIYIYIYHTYTCVCVFVFARMGPNGYMTILSMFFSIFQVMAGYDRLPGESAWTRAE